MQCNACGSNHLKPTFVDEAFMLDGIYVIVDYIPAQICARCGATLISRETDRAVRRLVNDHRTPGHAPNHPLNPVKA